MLLCAKLGNDSDRQVFKDTRWAWILGGFFLVREAVPQKYAYGRGPPWVKSKFNSPINNTYLSSLTLPLLLQDILRSCGYPSQCIRWPSGNHPEAIKDTHLIGYSLIGTIFDRISYLTVITASEINDDVLAKQFLRHILVTFTTRETICD